MRAHLARWIFVATALTISPAGAKPPAPSAPAARPPVFSLPGLRGTVALDSLRGRVVLIDFWASWCTPCRKSFPWLAQMQAKYGPRGFTVVAINVDKEREAALEFLQKNPAPFRIAFDPQGTVAQEYRVPVLPTSFLVGRDGSLLLSHPGFDSKRAADFEARIEEACSR